MKRFLAVLACLWAGVAYADQNTIVIPETGAAWDIAHPATPPLPHTFENTAKYFINPALKSITSNFSGSGCGGITSPVPWQWCVDTVGRQVYMNTAPAAGTPFSFTPVFSINSIGSLVPNSTPQRPVNPKDLGAVCNGSTDDHTALQAAVTQAIAQNRPLYIPGQYCMNSASLTLSASIDIFGDGPQNSVIAMTTDAPAFVWTIGSTIERFDWHDFSVFASGSSTGAGILTQGGSGATFWQHGQFRNIHILGFLYGIEVNNATASNWNVYDGVNCEDGGVQMQYCIYSPQGSGTGNVYTHFLPRMNRSTAAVLRYEGSGKNVGDIIVTEGHFCCNGSVISIGAGTVYRSRISIVSSQYDAGVVKAFDFDTTGVPYTDIRLMGNNSGGSTTPGIPANTQASIIDNMDVNVRRAGTANGTSGVGSFSTPIFSVTFPTGIGSPTFGYTATHCKIVVTGLVGNVGAGGSSAEYIVLYNNTTPTADAGPAQHSPSSAWTISYTASGNTLTFNADITETGGSSFDAQIACTGGIFTLAKLP